MKRVLLLIVVLGITSSMVSAYATSGTTLLLGSSTPGTASGRAYDLREIGSKFTISRGVAQVTGGQALYMIDNIFPNSHDSLRVYVFLTNPEELGKVLNNPNSFIDVGLWYEDSDGSSKITVDNNEVTVEDTGVSAKLSRVHAEALLKLSDVREVRDNYYIVAQITVPGGIPPGQQEKQDLNFNIALRA